MRNPNDELIQKLANHDKASRERYEYLIRTARRNYCEGVLEEPRGYYDVLAVPAGDPGAVVNGNPDVFRNGEQFPVRLTHMVAAMRGIDTAGASYTDERQIQRVALRLTFHDQAYMGQDVPFPNIPLWGNKKTAVTDVIALSSSSWRFDRPFILSARDSMNVRVVLEEAPGLNRNRRVTVSFSGIGMLSLRPYFLSARATLTDTAETTLATDRFRNDGTEPIVITDMSVHCSALDNATDPTGDITRCRVQVNQIGNGTQAEWFTGPLDVNGTGLPLSQCPGVLLGVDSGAAVVHRFPGEGLIWEPGEGISVAMHGVANGPLENQANQSAFVALGLFGYIAVS